MDDDQLDDDNQHVAAGEEVIEDEDQEIEDEADLEIQGGEQQIEDDGFPTEQEMIDQNLTPEQIQQILIMKAQREQQQQQEQMYGQEVEDYEEEQDQMGQDQHQMRHIYGQKKKKKVKSQSNNMDQRVGSGQIVSSSRYKQARDKKSGLKQGAMGSVKLQENLDPNALKRLMQAPRPQTGKVRPSGPIARIQRPQTAKNRQPQQTSYKQFIASQNLQSTRASRQTRVTSATNQQKPPHVAKQSSRKRTKGVKKEGLNTISHPENEDNLEALVQQQQEMPMFNEEFLNQLSEEQLQQVIQHQQALIQQNPQRSASGQI